MCRPSVFLLALAVTLAATGCAQRGPGDPAALRTDEDRAACRTEAHRVGVVAETLDVAAQGAIVLAALAWGRGSSGDGVRDAAVFGALLAGGAQATDALQRRQRWEAACLARRGQPVAMPAGPVPMSMSMPLPASPPAGSPSPALAPPTGVDGYGAARLARDQQCSAAPVAALVEKGPGFEQYRTACDDGRALAIRCEFGHCRLLH